MKYDETPTRAIRKEGLSVKMKYLINIFKDIVLTKSKKCRNKKLRIMKVIRKVIVLS